MLIRIFAIAALIIALFTIWAAYTQRSALSLRQEKQSAYWSRHGTSLSGQYQGGTWIFLPSRSSYGDFRGGGPGAGK
ncbi:MAG: hypothetical protein BRC40_05235 [Cyanobacteria bacterium QH_8_48_120]|jgi:hypothetical protein|nr:MAG: hypothetical protein BRC34_04160 [Cyanobacteria bacterium QH_1_48_107]PSO58195.1 MAG: hypothetical protein BRC35_06110 [Cyanobacteria bacterium QH_10_48_56]PSO60390.1 MAG: hypothetical protein BRC36_13790 [Cyanobacteria bacterium QH_2_48_84]PSO62149.1 MAG: hypothetical protein BRC39_06710 [Cyanobacteria bacterium QH_7_48_89]PSO63607.1 MAG: hypothetical protein BRC38_13470 [Cyanobacteria bacterium QH_6_48_35]PSO70396.1 MAG: hypothetical protein BRC42_10135 [Cyanobacteria bacterium QS_1_